MSRDSEARPPKQHTRREVAEVFGVHPETVKNWLDAGKLRGLTLADILEFDRARITRVSVRRGEAIETRQRLNP